MSLKVFQLTQESKSNGEETPLEMEPLFDEKDSEWHTPLEEGLGSSPIVPANQKSSFCNWKCDFPHLGLLLGVASSLMFSLCSLIVKLLNTVPSHELAVFRFIGVFLGGLPLVIAQGDPLFPKERRVIIILRGLFGSASLMLQFYAFRHMPLGDASVIVFCAPVFVAIFAKVFLKEECTIFHVILIMITLTGVTLITRPPWLFGTMTDPYTISEWKGAIAAFCATIVASGVYVTLRHLKDMHYSVILFDFSIVALIISATITLIYSQPCLPRCGYHRWLVILIGFLSFSGQIFKTKALQLEEAGPVAIARTIDVVFAFIWQFLFFGEIPDPLTILGTLLVTSSVLFLGIRRWIKSKPKNAPVRKLFSCLLW